MGGAIVAARLAWVLADGTVAVMQAGHECCPARRAERSAGVSAGKPQPFGGHAVEVRSLEIRLAVTTQVAISQVVGKDEDEIWGGRLCVGHLGKKAGEAKEGKMQPTERERL